MLQASDDFLPAQPAATPRSPWADPGAANEELAVEEFPSFLFFRLSGVMQRDVVGGYLADFGLNTAQWHVLSALAAFTPIPFSELVKRSLSDKARVSRSLQALEGRELAEVEPDPAHGKRLVCRITPRGRALYRKLMPRAQEAQASILRLLDRDERVALYSALIKLRAALDARL